MDRRLTGAFLQKAHDKKIREYVLSALFLADYERVLAESDRQAKKAIRLTSFLFSEKNTNKSVLIRTNVKVTAVEIPVSELTGQKRC